MEVTNLLHARCGKAAALIDLFFLEVGHDALDDISHLFHIDGERHDVGPSAALFFVERFAADLRQVELDRRVKVIDDVVHLAYLLGQFAVIGLQYREHAVQHLLDEVGQPHGFARGVADRELGRVERRRIEIARLGGIVHVVPGGQQALGHARDLLGKKQEPKRNDDIEQEVEIDGDLSVVEGCRREQLFDVGQQRHDDGAADQTEQEIAQRHAPRFGRRSHGIEHREQAASEIGAQHQAQRDMQGNHLRRRQRGGEQHHRKAGIGKHGEYRGDEHVEQHVAGQRAEDDLHPCASGQRLRGKHDQLQRQDDQTEPDQNAAETTELARLAAHEKRHA